jgi:hypothetical protein
MATGPQAGPHQEALGFGVLLTLGLEYPAPIGTARKFKHQTVVSLFLDQSQFPALDTGYTDSQSLAEPLLTHAPTDASNFLAGQEVMRTPIGIRQPSHELLRICSFHRDMPAGVTDKCRRTDDELLSSDISFDVREPFIEASRVANKTVHRILSL